MNIFQVYFHRHLHVRVGDKDIRERILYSAVHLLERSVELAGLLRHCHGVSAKYHSYFIHIVNQPLLFTLLEATATRKHPIKKGPPLFSIHTLSCGTVLCADCNDGQIEKNPPIPSVSIFQ